MKLTILKKKKKVMDLQPWRSLQSHRGGFWLTHLLFLWYSYIQDYVSLWRGCSAFYSQLLLPMLRMSFLNSISFMVCFGRRWSLCCTLVFRCSAFCFMVYSIVFLLIQLDMIMIELFWKLNGFHVATPKGCPKALHYCNSLANLWRFYHSMIDCLVCHEEL